MPEEKNKVPANHRELKPTYGNQGCTVCLGGRNWISSVIKKNQVLKKGEKEVITLSKTRFIPESIIKSLGLPDHLFVGGPDKPVKKSESVKKPVAAESVK